MRQGGSIAEQTGKTFEKTIEGMISSAGYKLIDDLNVAQVLLEEKIKKKWYCKQYNRFLGIYEIPIRIDFVLVSPKFQEGLAIEVKFQKTGGSVDEKYPYVILNMKKIGINCLMLLEGRGYRDVALSWCEKQQNEKIIVVEGYLNIQNWILNNL